MITCRPVSRKHIEKTQKKALTEKLDCASIDIARSMNLYVSSYYEELGLKFNKIIIAHRKRAKNGFKYLPLKEQQKRLSKIRPAIERIAQLNNPNHLHIGVARELAENVFYEIKRVYAPILEQEYSRFKV